MLKNNYLLMVTMASPLDMAGTIEFYRSYEPILTALVNAGISGRDSSVDLPNIAIRDEGGHFLLTRREIYAALHQFPPEAQQRAKTSGIYGKPDLWFAPPDGDKIQPTNDPARALSPTAIIPSYTDNRGGTEDPQIHLFGLGRSIESGTIDERIGRIIHAEGLIHEYTHVLNWPGKRSIYNGQPAAPILEMAGKTISALDALIEFAQLMEGSTPMSHYSSFYWNVQDGNLKAKDNDVFLAADEELAETAAAFFLGFSYTPQGDRRLHPFIDRPEIRRFVIDYLQAKIVD